MSTVETRKWWYSLTPEQQSKFVDKKVEEKRIKRNRLMAKSMIRLKLSFDCRKCIHCLTKNCTDRPKRGCLYFADFINNIFGPEVA